MSRTAERYARATSSSHLRVEVRPGDIDSIIAAGWVKVGLSTELCRLTVEIEGIDKRLLKIGPTDSRLDWAMLATRLQSLPRARQEVVGYAHWLAKTRYPEVPTAQVLPIALGVMAQILLPTCPVCDGREYELIPGTPTKSHKACRCCKGTGIRPLQVPGGRRGFDFAAALQAGIESKLSVLFEVMSRYQRNQEDLPVGTAKGNARVAERCEQVLRDNPNDGAARQVLARTRELSA